MMESSKVDWMDRWGRRKVVQKGLALVALMGLKKVGMMVVSTVEGTAPY